MAPLFYQDPIRLSCSADVLDHQSLKLKGKHVGPDSSLFFFATNSESASGSGNGCMHGIVDARQPLNAFRSDIEIIRQIPKLMVDISNRSPTRMDDAKNAKTTTPTTLWSQHQIQHHDTKDKEEKIGQKRNARISFEAHPFGQNKRKTRISVEVHPFLVFDDESNEQELHMDRRPTTTTTATTS